MELNIDAIRLKVADLTQARRFYQECLGLWLTTAALDRGYLEFQTGSLVLRVEQSYSRLASDTRTQVIFRVSDVISSYTTLLSRGVRFIQGPEWLHGSMSAEFTDPDGNRLALVATPSLSFLDPEVLEALSYAG